MNTADGPSEVVQETAFDYTKGFPSPHSITAVGFWLPCGRTNFFNHERDKDLIRSTFMSCNNLDFHNAVGENVGNNLQSTTFRRLSIVLFEKHYTHVYWRIPEYRLPYPDESDPDSALFVCTKPDKIVWPAGCARPYGLMLLVNDDGFYLWVAVHKGDDLSESKKFQSALKQYVRDEMMGGDFFSHVSGLSQAYLRMRVEGDMLDKTLKTYRDEKLGILTFFQLNLVLEGMFNYAFDERLFFTHDSDREMINSLKKEYSLGAFAGLISTVVDLKEDSSEMSMRSEEDLDVEKYKQKVEERTREVSGLTEQLFKELQDTNSAPLIAEGLIRLCLDNYQTRRDILRQFLRSTSAATLQRLKWRIERCRRALLDEMISIMHVRQPLIQAEPPDLITDDLREATEDQLRGYVMLISAKMPLIKNVQRYINTIVKRMIFRDPEAVEDIEAFINSWNGLFEAIEDNVRGLENAIDQARSERQLHEEQRIRIEQEAVAEIERMREQSGRSGVDGDSQTFGYAENIIALISVGIALLALTLQSIYPGTSTRLSEVVGEILLIQTVWDLALLLLIVPVAALFLYFGYAVIHWIIEKLVEKTEKFRERLFPFRKRYYYEMDVRLDEPIKRGVIPELIEVETKKEYKKRRIQFNRDESGQVRPVFTKPDRYAYRGEIESRDEGYYKIHAITDIYWPRQRKLWKWYLWQMPFAALRYLKMQTYITYEILYHRPSGEHSYLLRECRLATTHCRMLTTQELQALKTLFAVNFVNPWLENQNNKLDPTNEREPLFALTRLHQSERRTSNA